METLIIQQGGLLMSSYLLSCEMPADLTREHFEQRNIFAVPFHFFLNDKEYIEDFGQTVPFSEFYKMIADGAMTRTSQPNISEYVAAFTPHLEKGMDIVHLCLSSGICYSNEFQILLQGDIFRFDVIHKIPPETSKKAVLIIP